ncbi:hypothetical protein [Micromonospora endolithica]|uniref:Bacterial Pleckstrin homology domain-containing protein n=1 Tax=Micromonospora endolithica TaxID=230091 RepID=A0A3A9Z5A4_9ACTN|nr:hypothetical protein [Micromonospora endolithica]RKN43488.1 hypothetical protein D7223_20825 [Micromonospora endolithica]TWJ24072.1 hypothetical protein JD76_04218 [Micromonospora endolithica]
MSTVHVTADRVRIRLRPVEKIFALHGDLDLPRSAVRTAEVLTDGLAATRGLRAPGLAIPGWTKVGTWRGRGARQYVAVRRGVPTLRLTLDRQRYDIVLVSTPDAHAVAAALNPE